MARSTRPVYPLPCLLAVFMLLIVSESMALAVSDRLPSFGMENINAGGGVITDADLQGKIVLLNLWASWCTGCKEEMPELVKLQDQFGSDHFLVVTVNIDNKMDNALSFMEKFPARIGRPLNFPVLYDKEKVIARTLRPKFLPTSYLVDAEGRIIFTVEGSITKDRVEEVRETIRSAMGSKGT